MGAILQPGHSMSHAAVCFFGSFSFFASQDIQYVFAVLGCAYDDDDSMPVKLSELPPPHTKSNLGLSVTYTDLQMLSQMQ